jgi:hypothetical protein
LAAEAGGKKHVYRTRQPWEKECCESFNGKLRDELLNGEIFYTLKEAQIIIEQCRGQSTIRSGRKAHWAIASCPEAILVEYRVTPEDKKPEPTFTTRKWTSKVGQVRELAPSETRLMHDEF